MTNERETDTESIVLEAMRAGLRGQRLPNFGDRLSRQQLLLINAVYNEARNWEAGQRAKSS